MVLDPTKSLGISNTRTLSPSHWAVLRAFELGDFRPHRLEQDIKDLQGLGYLQPHSDGWRLTEGGQTLIALRRQL